MGKSHLIESDDHHLLGCKSTTYRMVLVFNPKIMFSLSWNLKASSRQTHTKMIFSEVVVKFFSYFKQEFPAQESSWDFFNAWKAKQEKVQSQLRIVEETLMFSPGSTNLLIEKAKSLILLEKPMAAAEILREVITSNPKDAEAISALAMSFYHQGDLKRCIETCDKALKLNPSMEDTKTMRTNASNFSDVFAKRKILHHICRQCTNHYLPSFSSLGVREVRYCVLGGAYLVERISN